MVSFTSDDWKYTKQWCEETIENQRKLLENVNKTYKEKLIANGRILALRELLNLPQQLTAAKGK